MNTSEIIEALERSSTEIPLEALDEAAGRREEIVPRLLEILEKTMADPRRSVEDKKYMAHLYAMYMLASFRETRAYPVLVRLFSLPGKLVFDIAGDVVVQDLPRILAAVSGGDPAGMKELVENEEANEHARASAIKALVTLVATGQQSRDSMMSYFVILFGKLLRKPSRVWTTLVSTCTDLWPDEVLEAVRQACEDGLVDPFTIKWSDVEEEHSYGKDDALARLVKSHYKLVGDASEHASWWSTFKDRAKPVQ